MVPATSSLPSIPCLASPWPWNSPLTCVHPWTGSTRRSRRLVLRSCKMLFKLVARCEHFHKVAHCICLCEGAFLTHSGWEWDAQRPLWISRGQPHRTVGGETASPRASDQPGCQVSSGRGRRYSGDKQTESDSAQMILKLTEMIPQWAQPLCTQVWARHPPASQTGVYEDWQCHRSWVSVSPGYISDLTI